MDDVMHAFLNWFIQFSIVSCCILVAAHLVGRKLRAARRKKLPSAN